MWNWIVRRWKAWRRLRWAKALTTARSKAFAKYVGRELRLKVGPPRFGAPEGPWVGYGKGWSFHDAMLFIDYTKFYTNTHVRPIIGGLPDGCEVGLEFYANP